MKKIAVVEDEAYMREELCSMLKKAGYETVEITAFETAVKDLIALLPDLVLLDLNLPEISGFQICQALKTENPVSCTCIDFQGSGTG